MKVVGIIKNDPITGVKYGTIEVDEPEIKIQQATDAYNQAQAIRAKRNLQQHKNNTKHK